MQAVRVPGIAAMAIVCAVGGLVVDPFVGTWVLDVAHSRINRGLRVKIERWKDTFHYSSEGVEYTALLDGEDYPIRGVASQATVSLRRLNERSIQRTYKRDGKPVSSAEMTVSPDGRFLTVRIKRLDVAASAGQWVNTYQKDPNSVGKDPFAGTWERNPVRSVGNSPSIIAFELLEGDRLHFTGNQVEYSARPDGQNYRVDGSIVSDSVALDRIDLRTLREVWKEAGKEVATVLRVVSADGGRMTATVEGFTPQGDRFENLYVYTRSAK